MDVLTSTEFRKRYATLKRATEVTVNGHVIGTWYPQGSPESADLWDEMVREGVMSPQLRAALKQRENAYNTRPFTPVPKKR